MHSQPLICISVPLKFPIHILPKPACPKQDYITESVNPGIELLYFAAFYPIHFYIHFCIKNIPHKKDIRIKKILTGFFCSYILNHGHLLPDTPHRFGSSSDAAVSL